MQSKSDDFWNRKIQLQLDIVERNAGYFALFLLVAILFYAVAVEAQRCVPLCDQGASARPGFPLALSISALTLFAAAALGGFLGFLFGVPRLLTRDGRLQSKTDGSTALADDPSPAAQNAKRAILSNSNLEEISDWLTKIIVGVALIEARPILDRLDDARRFFQVALPTAPAPGEFLLLLSIAGGVGSFLFFYLETRTRISMLFAAIEGAQAAVISAVDAQASTGQPLYELIGGAPPIDDACPGSTFDIAARKTRPLPNDDRILGHDFDELSTPEDFAAWGAAQARRGNYGDAERALKVAVEKSPNDIKVIQRLAEVQFAGENFDEAAETLGTALQRAPGDWSIGRLALLVSLWQDTPAGINNALNIVKAFKTNEAAKEDPWFHAWHAAAQGQYYASIKAPSQEKEKIYQNALNAVREVKRLAPERDNFVRRVLRGMLRPHSEDLDPDDNDLAIFDDVEKFPEIVQEIMA